jgi:hypothetical protein
MTIPGGAISYVVRDFEGRTAKELAGARTVGTQDPDDDSTSLPEGVSPVIDVAFDARLDGPDDEGMVSKDPVDSAVDVIKNLKETWYDMSWANQLRAVVSVDTPAQGKLVIEGNADYVADPAAFENMGLNGEQIFAPLNVQGAQKGGWQYVHQRFIKDMVFRAVTADGNNVDGALFSLVKMQVRRAQPFATERLYLRFGAAAVDPGSFPYAFSTDVDFNNEFDGVTGGIQGPVGGLQYETQNDGNGALVVPGSLSFTKGIFETTRGIFGILIPGPPRSAWPVSPEDFTGPMSYWVGPPLAHQRNTIGAMAIVHRSAFALSGQGVGLCWRAAMWRPGTGYVGYWEETPHDVRRTHGFLATAMHTVVLEPTGWIGGADIEDGDRPVLGCGVVVDGGGHPSELNYVYSGHFVYNGDDDTSMGALTAAPYLRLSKLSYLDRNP